MSKLKFLLPTLMLLGLSVVGVHAEVADPADIVTTGTTVFEAVSTLVVAMVGFFIVVRIVKGISR